MLTFEIFIICAAIANIIVALTIASDSKKSLRAQAVLGWFVVVMAEIAIILVKLGY